MVYVCVVVKCSEDKKVEHNQIEGKEIAQELARQHKARDAESHPIDTGHVAVTARGFSAIEGVERIDAVLVDVLRGDEPCT